MNRSRRYAWIAWTWGAVLLVLHLDFWRPQRVHLHFGWLPEEILYRILWMFLAWFYVLFVCARVWRERD